MKKLSLKPCPICGGMAEMARKIFTRFEPKSLVICRSCGLRTRECKTADAAAEAWNGRKNDE